MKVEVEKEYLEWLERHKTQLEYDNSELLKQVTKLTKEVQQLKEEVRELKSKLGDYNMLYYNEISKCCRI